MTTCDSPNDLHLPHYVIQDAPVFRSGRQVDWHVVRLTTPSILNQGGYVALKMDRADWDIAANP